MARLIEGDIRQDTRSSILMTQGRKRDLSKLLPGPRLRTLLCRKDVEYP